MTFIRQLIDFVNRLTNEKRRGKLSASKGLFHYSICSGRDPVRGDEEVLYARTRIIRLERDIE